MPGNRSDRQDASPATAIAPTVTGTIVVRVPADGWPGGGLAEALGDGFLVTASEHILADVVVLVGVGVSTVRQLRQLQPRLGIVVHSTQVDVVDMIAAGADVALTDAPLLEVAARIRAVARRLGVPSASNQRTLPPTP